MAAQPRSRRRYRLVLLRFAFTKKRRTVRTIPQVSVSVESNSGRLFRRTQDRISACQSVLGVFGGNAPRYVVNESALSRPRMREKLSRLQS
jgi:hypothetical protein